MGLDMYVYSTDRQIEEDVDFPDGWPSDDELAGKDVDWSNFDSLNPDIKIYQWRKHPNLHGWMEELYRSRGGTDQDFNGSTLKLTENDLDVMQGLVELGVLPHTTGFFFGESCPEYKEDDLEFIKLARAALAEGKTIYYTSSW